MTERTKRILFGTLVFPFALIVFESAKPKQDEQVVVTPVVVNEQVVTPEPELPKVWVCEDCSANEKKVLKFLQDEGITDNVALSVLMANIKQESKFHPNICEGGARVPYHRCYHGGFGLIQWTTNKRYLGLRQFVNRHGGDPSTLDTQLQYMVSEVEWRKVENIFKTPGLPQDEYMSAAHRWLRWGVYGDRTTYSNQYLNRLTQV